ncbi:hypothetical protein CEUSTIGMA_g8207.t1 [Chlamydomonas eustigma]|uniref:CASTOR/POLLUX/SYM8 ion channel conserved domain-containing protein n=1 Tax=Chlamydomonas eustigma TaxID=1157962 RepID=A0A250XD17_9CHLO|nr:hypothetical protein CEUSTIGMA_g8207.t1 [Chlamydomonas eustigma]|eukprot:GAX80772.1 hypothetical protein CEUSTIGMA_g8207.t1 [Chlamydomonas eustigma]
MQRRIQTESLWRILKSYVEKGNKTVRSAVFVWSKNAADLRVRVGIIALLSMVTTFIGAIVYSFVSGETLSESLFVIYAVLYAVPGSSVTRERSLGATLVVNVVFLMGLFVFAVLLGMIGEEVATQVMNLRSGTGEIRIRGHILLLNWNSSTMDIIDQLAYAQHMPKHPFHNRPLVLLASKDRSEMEHELAALRSKPGMRLEIHLRTGLPYQVEDLKLVSAEHAAYTLLMYPDVSEGLLEGLAPQAESSGLYDQLQSNVEALNAMTVAALSTFETFSRQNLVVQVRFAVMENLKQLEVVHQLLATAGRTIQICRLPENSVVDRLIAQSCLQHGVLQMFQKIMSLHSEVGFRWMVAPENKNELDKAWSYGEIRRRLHSCMPIGYVSISVSQVHLNPEDRSRIMPGDRLFVLQQSELGPNVELSPNQGIYDEAAFNGSARSAGLSIPEPDPALVIVAGWPQTELEDLVSGFENFAPPGSRIIFLMDSMPDEFPELEALELKFLVVENPLDAEALLEADIDHADALVLACPRGLSYPDNDALIMSKIYEVQQLLEGMGRSKSVHIVAKSSNTGTFEIALETFKKLPKQAVTFELVTTNSLASSMLVQVAGYPDMFPVCNELMIIAEGNEIYIVDVIHLGFQLGERVSVAEIYETAKNLEMTMLGLSRGPEMRQILAPVANTEIVITTGDKIIVVADLVN